MDIRLVELMEPLACKHPMDLFQSKRLFDIIKDLKMWYRGHQITFMRISGSFFQCHLLDTRGLWVLRDLTVELVRCIHIRMVDYGNIVGQPVSIDYNQPTIDTSPDTDDWDMHMNVKKAIECLVVAGAMVIMGSHVWGRYKKNTGSK